MHWVFSTVPGGNSLYFAAQRYWTRTLPVDDDTFIALVGTGQRHLDLIRGQGRNPEVLAFYEFGAGWDLVIPLTFFAAGVDRQVNVDIRRLMRPQIVDESVRKFQRLGPGLALGRIPAAPIGKDDPIGNLERAYGIRYLAPVDARMTNLPAESFDCITSTDTLEHIPPVDITRILTECRRLLRPRGLLSVRIDYRDHYSMADRRISTYNFLRYSRRAWRTWNPPLHFQNRLRHDDYLALFTEAGFEILEEEIEPGTAADMDWLSSTKLATEFAWREISTLAIRTSFILATRH